MKRTLITLTISLVTFGLGYWTGVIKKSVDEKIEIVDEAIKTADNSNNEDFSEFIHKFITDSSFQLERIKFPLKSERLPIPTDSDPLPEPVSILIQRTDWKANKLFRGELFKVEVYNNFQKEFQDTDERLFHWEGLMNGINNGVNIEYKFQRVGGLWYLTEYNDFSD
jgi:hypothetical protein